MVALRETVAPYRETSMQYSPSVKTVATCRATIQASSDEIHVLETECAILMPAVCCGALRDSLLALLLEVKSQEKCQQMVRPIAGNRPPHCLME